VPYSPKKVLEQRLTIDIQINSNELERVNGSNTSLMIKEINDNAEYKPKETGMVTFYVWELVCSKSTPDYEEIPILMLNNPDSPSAKVQGSISVGMFLVTGFYGTVAYGFNIYDQAKNGQYGAISLTIYRTEQPTYQYKLGFYDSITVDDGEKSHIYIMAKALYAHFKEVKITMTADGTIVNKEYTGKEKIDAQITDVYTDPSGHAYGGEKRGLPNNPSSFMEYFFQGTQMRHIYRSNDHVLYDGDLDAEESEPLSLLYDTLDIEEDLNFGVGISVGAFMAALIEDTPVGFLAPVIAGLVISLNYVEEHIMYIDGGIQNNGIYSEEVWMALSEYVYSYETSLGTKTFNVPAGTYFYFPTVTSGDGGGCPYLLVYTGNGFVNEGLLNIHSDSPGDVTYRHVLVNSPTLINGKYVFRLIEHNATISHIDYVRLFGILDNGTAVELPLIRAVHNVLGDVTTWLLLDDDARIVGVGAHHLPEGSSSNVITLEFASIGGLRFKAFVFEIQGSNLLIKY